MRRREFLTGAAALAAFAKVDSAEALTTRQLAVLGEANPASGMPPAPPGYHWAFVTESAQQVTETGNNVVELQRN